jgi:transcriptional regulator with XRE-family HTH domain
MPETAGGIGPLNWPAQVAEAIRRRKAEKLTQKEHAALASVSVPTIIAFDRGELTLSLGKAMDILRVVGLIEESPPGGTHESFVQEAFARWRALIGDLPKNSPGRSPAGWYRIDYMLEGDLKDINLDKFKDLIRQAMAPYAPFPLFHLPKIGNHRNTSELVKRFSIHRPILMTDDIINIVEYWLPPGRNEFDRYGSFLQKYCDFWRASFNGHMFLLRNYWEDIQETLAPGTIFDITLPVWRIGEAFLHAARLARLIAQDPARTIIRLRVLYTGLQGRNLRAWDVDYFDGGRSHSDGVTLEGTAPVASVETDLAQHVLPLVASLFERFGVTGLTAGFVEAELARIRQNNFVG